MKKIQFALLILLIISCQGQQNSKLDHEKLNQVESNQKNLDALKDAGEKFKVIRDIFHWLYFKNKSDLNRFLGEIKSKGFDHVSSNVIEDKLPYQLQIKIKDFVSKTTMDSQAIYLVDIAKKYGGEYDGWETIVENSNSNNSD